MIETARQIIHETTPAGEEQHVGFDVLGVDDAGRQAQQGVAVALVQQPAVDHLAGPTFEQDIIRYDHRCPAGLL